ncbi:MAG TPA: helix-turn-helix domain-containing protein [Pseudonocardiaceae bacterium]
MAEAKWKLVVDQQGVTISNDRFQLTTTEAQPLEREASLDDVVFGVDGSGQMETIISELEAMTRRTYGQFCGLSRALEVVGERWAMFIVRDLLVSAKSFAELREGLPRITTDILHARLREMEHSGVVRRKVSPRPAEPVLYELTEFGAQLDDITLRLGQWGARLLGTPRPEEIVTTSSLIMAMRATFQQQAAAGVLASFELRIGEIVFHLKVADGALQAVAGPLADADLHLEPGMALKGLMSGEISPADAAAHGVVYTGDPALLARFTEIFHIVGTPDAA